MKKLKKMVIWIASVIFIMNTSFTIQAMTLTPEEKSRLLSEFGMSMLVGSGGGEGTRQNINGWRFILDPGHGGHDPGAIGPTGLTEKEVNLAVAQILRQRLRSHTGVYAELTRNGDFFVSSARRAQIAIDQRADRFISIHHNAGPPHVNYTVVLVHPNFVRVSRDMAGRVVDQLAIELGLRKGITPTGVAPRNIEVLRRLVNSRIPAILVEASFISNRAQEQLLRQHGYRVREAEAIYRGILNHSRNYSGSARD